MNAPLVNPEIGAKLRDWRRYYEAKLGFRGHWYAALMANELGEGEVVPVTLLGEKILLRRTGGKVHALSDRCLHRGVQLSRKVECYTRDTITCWYHGWTYRWADGKLCDILTDPGSRMIGTRALATYPVEEAKGMLFLFVGDGDPPPLARDLPPGFLDEDRAAYGIRRIVASNWRIGAENGFDTTHIFIHKDSPFITEMDAAVPLGFAAGAKTPEFILSEDPDRPIGITDPMTEHYRPVFATTVDGQPGPALKAATGKHNTIHTISMWMPGILAVENHPDGNTIQYEFYVPLDEDRHSYFQIIERLGVKDEGDVAEFEERCRTVLDPLALRGFNDDDIWAREALQQFYQDDWGWLSEQLMEQDRNLFLWRQLASRWGRDLQTLDHAAGRAPAPTSSAVAAAEPLAVPAK